MNKPRIALGIRAQLLLVLTVFLAIPWLGYEYVRELERVSARRAGAHAGRHRAGRGDRAARPPAALRGEARRRWIRIGSERRGDEGVASATGAPSAGAAGSPEIEQIIHGLSRTTARIWVIDREQQRARARRQPETRRSDVRRHGARVIRASRAPGPRSSAKPSSRLYARVLSAAERRLQRRAHRAHDAAGRDVEGALAGILTIDRRPTADGKAVIVSAAQPDLGRRRGQGSGDRRGDDQRGARRAQSRLRAALQRSCSRRCWSGSVALTLYASWLSTRIRRLRDEAEARDRRAGSRARRAHRLGCRRRDRRPFAQLLRARSRGSREYASYQEAMASRLSHELRTPIAVVRSSLDNLALQHPAGAKRASYMARAQEGLDRLAHIITRMTEAARLETEPRRGRARALRPGAGRRRLRRRLSRSLSAAEDRASACLRVRCHSTARPT